MQQVFYNATEGTWFDFNTRIKAHNLLFYGSVAAPLFGECYQPLNMAKPDGTIAYLNVSLFQLPLNVAGAVCLSVDKFLCRNCFIQFLVMMMMMP